MVDEKRTVQRITPTSVAQVQHSITKQFHSTDYHTTANNNRNDDERHNNITSDNEDNKERCYAANSQKRKQSRSSFGEPMGWRQTRGQGDNRREGLYVEYGLWISEEVRDKKESERTRRV